MTGCFKTTEFGTQGTYIPYDPAAIIDKVPNLTVDGTPHNWCLDDDGSIIPYHQVYIDSSNDWDKLATRIANGASFNRRRLLILDNDITVGTMLGTEEHPFDGIFDGQNHTLTFNLTTDESGCAPFRYIKDAYIHDLKIDGTLEHSVGAKTRLAGVAAYTSGNNNGMENITVSSTIRSQASSFHHAGLVAQINDGRVIFLNCAFKGKLLCDGNSSGCGGLVAVNMGNGTGFQNCLFAPTACTVGTDNSCTISRDIKEPSIIINTCYTQELGDLQGSRAYTVATVPDNVYCYLWKGPDNVNYYQPVSTYIGDLKHTYNYNDGKPIDIDYTFYCNYGLQDAEKYTATIRNTTDGTEVTDVTDIGQYTLSVSANEGSGYHGTVERTFYVTASSLPMNDEGHFLINSADDWNTLCELTSYEHQAEYQFFEGRVVELTADITVTQQLGFFCGTLAGNGHKLTLNIGTDQDPYTRDCAALIYNLRGNAVVENLHVDGTIITSTGRFAAGIAGITHDNVRINNCRSSIRIKTTYDGECHNGGLVGFAQDGKLAIENCLFDGCFTSVNNMATHWSGCVGVAYAAVRINSCLFFANRHEMISVPLTNNATFYLPADASSVSLQNCCHTVQNWGEEQQGTYVADNMEAGPQIAALGYEGWRIKFDWPQWQAYYQEGETRPLVLPRYDYHTAVAGHIEGLQGNGTDSDPYLIGSTADWNLFATSINNNVGAEAYYQLTEDITIDQGHLVGTTVPYSTVNVQYGERRTFRGTFDGNGHTLTLNMATNGDCAPFIYAQDCTIKNLTIAGSITTNHEHAAGLIVNAAGTVNITGCRGSLTINSSLTGAGSHGAFVAQSSGTTNIEGCVFDGSIIGATTYSCGGFVGERSSGTVNIDNSFFIPAAVTLDTENANDNSATFCVGNCSITNSYYTQHLHTSQGTALYSVTANEGIDLSIGGDGVLKEYASGIAMKGDGILLDGVFYAPEGAEVPIEKLELVTGYSPQNATIAPNAGTYTEGTLTMPAQNVVFQTSTPIALSTYTIQFDANGGTGDAMANMNFTYGDAPKALTANTFSRTAHDFKGWNTEPDGIGTAYVDGQTIENLTTASGTTITLYAQWEPWIAEGFGKTDSYAPDGTADNPYVISTAEEWDLLCDYISSGKSGLASAHYRLDKNLTVSRMMGTAKNPFRGTFEGTACTLTLDLTGVDEVEADPETPESSEDFENLENPEPSQSIELPDVPLNPEDVPVEETLHALAPFAYVNGATIKNLHTTGTINGETSFFAAGIVGKAEGNTTLQSCYSSVAITSTANEATLSDGRGAGGEAGDEESPMLGGIVAQSTGTLSFTDCLFDGTINAENTSHCGGFLGQRQSGTVTFTNCLMVGELNCPTDGCGTYYQADETDAYTIENSYYHTAYGEGEDEGQGTQTSDTGETLKERLGENWAVTATEAVVPFIDAHDLRYTKLTLDSPAFPWTGSAITVGYTVKNVYNVDLIENTDFTVTFENAEGTELTEVTELGEYLMTINGIGDYIGSKSVHFYVCKLGEGEKFPFQIDKDFKFEDAGYYYVTLPKKGEANPKVIHIPEGFTHSFKVYDDGGKETFDEGGDVLDGRYDDNSGTLQIIAPEGLAFNVQGTIKIEGGYDYLTIYDSTTSGINTIFGPASGEENVNLITSGNSVIFDFQVDEGRRYEGIDLTVSMVPPLPITDLADDDSEKPENEKNAWVLAANKGEELSISLNGRTLYRDGSWNTLCLPFDIPDIQSTLLRGATIKTLSTAEYNNGMLTMNFSQNLNSIEAGKPYIVKWADTAPLYTAYDGTRHPYDPDRDYDKLLSGGDDWWGYSKNYYSGEDLFCEFVLSEPMAVTGYTMKTDFSGDGPIKWTLKGKRSENDDWMPIDSRDVTESPEDEVTEDAKTYTLAEGNQGTYQYFRLDVLDFYAYMNLGSFQLEGDVVMEASVNPTFRNVTVNNELHPVENGGVTFKGCYSSLDDTNGLLLDAHNTDGNAFHAMFSLPDVTWYTDAEHTVPLADSDTPFDPTTGTVRLYYTPVALALANDDSAESKKNTELIEEKDGELVNVTLDGRTLYKDETWNDLCVPFDIDNIAQTPLRGAIIKAYTSTEYAYDLLNWSFEDANSIEAGKPYLVKWQNITLPCLNASDNDLAALNLVREIPVVDDGLESSRGESENYDKLVDGNTGTKYLIGTDETIYVEFHYANAFTPKGYTLWTANDFEGWRNPESWTIKAKNEGDADWTTLTTVDNSNDDKLPMEDNVCSIFELDNNAAYQYFRFEATAHKRSYYGEGDVYDFQLAELNFFTESHINTDIVNPVFEGVTIKSNTRKSDAFLLEGSYSSLASTDGQLLDAHNAGGNAFHSALNISALNAASYDLNFYSDAELTTPVTSVIPFDASTGNVTLYSKWALTMNNNDSQAAEEEKNATIISDAAEYPIPCDVTLADRTLYKDGDWNTLCLPFDLGNPEAEEGHYFDGTLLEGATVKTLASTEFADGALTMNFEDATTVEAGVPYLVKWTSGENLVAPVFEDVTISNSVVNLETDYVDFLGTYGYMGFNADDRSILFLGADNTLYYPQSGASIGACRAYFQLKGLNAADIQHDVKMYFGEEEETGISLTPNPSPEGEGRTAAWFDLNGRRLNGKPTSKGLYINNGRKVIIN